MKERRHVKKNVTSKRTSHTEKENLYKLRKKMLKKKKLEENKGLVSHENDWFKTEQEWKELIEEDESYNWREHEWPNAIDQTDGNLMKLLQKCHTGNGKKCQLDTLLDRKELEKSNKSSRKYIDYIKCPVVSVTKQVESFIEVLPSQKIPKEWVLGRKTEEEGGSSQERKCKEEEVEEEEETSSCPSKKKKAGKMRQKALKKATKRLVKKQLFKK